MDPIDESTDIVQSDDASVVPDGATLDDEVVPRIHFPLDPDSQKDEKKSEKEVGGAIVVAKR
jgi:hypothetical protein